MFPDIPAASRAFLGDLRGFLDRLPAELVAAAQAEYAADELEPGPASLDVWRRMGTDRWVGVTWPVAEGGRARPPIDGWLFAEEMAGRGLFAGGLTISSIAPTLIRVGTPKQRGELVDGMRTADVIFGVAYSEPEAGSDLAALRLRARPVDGGFQLDGVKIYTTCANIATHLWVAARTSVQPRQQDGISVFVVPTATPGITIRRLMTQADGRTNEVVFDGVRVPATALVGEVDHGWGIIRTALAFERALPYGVVALRLGELIGHLARAEAVQPVDGQRSKLMQLLVDVEACRVLGYQAAVGRATPAAASMNKVWLTELRQRMAATGLSLLGEWGTLGLGEPDAPLSGHYERMYRASVMRRFAAGANEIQREIVARAVLDAAR